MKLLIADDERITREGLIQNINWKSLGIHEILDAENGAEALSLYHIEHPDIILTDVRMPQMDGIALANAITKENATCPIIFMSGYSDKEYLKAAIKLHAVRYVEKPIQLSEVEEAIAEAIETLSRHTELARTSDFLKREAFSKLALELTTGVTITPSLLNSLSLSSEKGCFFTMLLRVYPSMQSYTEESFHEIFQKIAACCKKLGILEVHTGKHRDFILVHFLYGSRMDSFLYEKLCHKVEDCLSEITEYTLCFGKKVAELSDLPQSYRSAVILQQNAFFSLKCVLHYEEHGKACPDSILKEYPRHYEEAMDAGTPEKAKDIICAFYEELLDNRSFLPDVIREIYYRLLRKLEQTAYDARLLSFHEKNPIGTTLTLVSDCRNLRQLQELFFSFYEDFIQAYQSDAKENETSTVFLIKDYIRQHYKDPDLSIKEIGDHVHLSMSYLCTYFKNETNTTLNQYLAEYRMNKAKKLLSDPRNRISEISSMVGYADGNYFSKSFKKNVGLSPSEYREKMTT